jgi:hypothetical protein
MIGIADINGSNCGIEQADSTGGSMFFHDFPQSL